MTNLDVVKHIKTWVDMYLTFVSINIPDITYK